MSTLARAWALKDACYAAWHTEPARAQDAAQALAALATPEAEPQVHALAHWTAGIAALAGGQLNDALLRLEQAQAGFEALADGQHAAETRVPQMVALSMLGRDDVAQRCAEQALAQFLQSGDERSAGKIELNLGTMLSRQDRHAEAEALYRRAAVRFARSGDAEYSIVADIGIANTLTWQYRFDEALRVNARARMRAGQRGLAILSAQAEQAIGRIELNRGRWRPALQALAAACSQLAAAQAPPQRRIEAEAALADAYLAVHLLDEAVTLYDQVIHQASALQAPTEEAWAWLQRARALGHRAEPEKALVSLDRARALYGRTGNPSALAYADLCRARFALAAGRASEALASAGEAAAALGAIPGWQLEAQVVMAGARLAQGDTAEAEAQLTEVLAAAVAQPAVRASCLLGLGRVAELRSATALATQRYEELLAEADTERRALPDDEFRAALAADAQQAHTRLVALAAGQGDAAGLLLALERGRARALAASLPDDSAPLHAPAESTLWRWLRARWQDAVAEGDDERRVALEDTLAETRRRAALAQPGPAPAAATAAPVPDLAQLQASLAPDAALLWFHLAGEQLLAVVLRPDAVAQVVVPATDLPDRVRGLRFQIDALRFGGAAALAAHGPQLQQRAMAHLRALYDGVWAPVAPHLAGCRQVVVMPDGGLHYLPFAALHDGQDWLLARHTLSLAPSAAVWQRLQGRPPRAWTQAVVVGVGGGGVDGETLPHVAHEVAAVAAAWAGPSTTLCGAAATQPAVLAAAAGADLLHLACHGRFRADNPAFCELLLADGPWTLMDLRQARLGAALVTLSACETGLSRIDPGGELLGLVRAFMLAGAETVVATLWPVSDEASAHLIADFYRALGADAAPAEALRTAQLAAARAGAHPWHWAGYTLHGRA
jgi:CHAT domain-containing protein